MEQISTRSALWCSASGVLAIGGGILASHEPRAVGLTLVGLSLVTLCLAVKPLRSMSAIGFVTAAVLSFVGGGMAYARHTPIESKLESALHRAAPVPEKASMCPAAGNAKSSLEALKS